MLLPPFTARCARNHIRSRQCAKSIYFLCWSGNFNVSCSVLLSTLIYLALAYCSSHAFLHSETMHYSYVHLRFLSCIPVLFLNVLSGMGNLPWCPLFHTMLLHSNTIPSCFKDSSAPVIAFSPISFPACFPCQVCPESSPGPSRRHFLVLSELDTLPHFTMICLPHR